MYALPIICKHNGFLIHIENGITSFNYLISLRRRIHTHTYIHDHLLIHIYIHTFKRIHYRRASSLMAHDETKLRKYWHTVLISSCNLNSDVPIHFVQCTKKIVRILSRWYVCYGNVVYIYRDRHTWTFRHVTSDFTLRTTPSILDYWIVIINVFA